MNTKYADCIGKYNLNKILPIILLLFFASPFFVSNAHSHDRDEQIVFGPKKIECEKGRPWIRRISFFTHEKGSDFTMKVENGDGKGRNRVSSAHITLKGEDVFSSSDFNQQTETLERQVTIKEHNIMKVRLEGDRESFIIISISKTKSPPISNGAAPNITGMVQGASKNLPPVL